MAHLVPLDRDCRNCRTRRATVVLRSNRNEVMGDYCAKCGETARAALQAAEDRREPRPAEPAGA